MKVLPMIDNQCMRMLLEFYLQLKADKELLLP
jgi:hypothetical protein